MSAVYARPVLVAIEGIDGAGKQTQSAALVRRAENAGWSVASLAFPRYGETFFAAAVQEMLRGELGEQNDPRLVGLLFAGDRLESRPLVEEALASVDLVVADRYVASNLAYQAARAPASERAAVMAWLETVEHEIFKMPRPALTVLLDLPVPLAAARIAHRPVSGGRPTGDRYEADHALLEGCRTAYHDLAADRENWAVVPLVEDGRELAPDEVTERVFAAVRRRRGD